MAKKTEGPNIIQITLAATLGYRQDVVCVPEAAAAGDGLHTVETETCDAGRTSGAFESGVSGDRVDLTDGAMATVAGKDLIAEITGVGAETPLVDAVVTAESTAAFGKNLKLAPAAERQTVRALRKSVARSAATGQSAGDEHALPA